MAAHTPIEHVALIAKKNHSFDSYVGTLPGANRDPTLAQAPSSPTLDPPHDHRSRLSHDTQAVRRQ